MFRDIVLTSIDLAFTHSDLVSKWKGSVLAYTGLNLSVIPGCIYV
jgi:hypothetical protein